MKTLAPSAICFAFGFAAFAQAAEPALTDIHIIPIKPGVNTIPRFAADGRAATIVRAWRGNGNAHGYNVFLVLLPRAEGNPLGVVRQEDNDSSTGGDAIRDDPFDGERTLGVKRFARAKLNGRVQSVMIAAHLDEAPSHVLADHATATIKVYSLKRSEGAAGDTPDYFSLAWTAHTTARYCNVDLALAETLHVPLPKDYAGPGC